MTEFDYIEHSGLRASLESDYREMHRCVEANAWKSAQVLAGSIVESLLMDYLVSRPDENGGKAATLKLDLSEVIRICLEEKAISSRTADLCAVIRSYRNLIHPGRLVRLGEPSPTKASCDIAVNLIDLIVEDIQAFRKSSVGLTAEQVLAKVISDSKSGSLMKHLLAEVRESHLLRLATVLLPEALSQYGDDLDNIFVEDRIGQTFRSVFSILPPSRQKEIVDSFALLLRQGSEAEIDRYRRGFFRAGDIKLASSQYQAMIKDHLLSSIGVGATYGDIKAAEGIGAFLAADDVSAWVNILVRVTISKTMNGHIKKRTREFFIAEHGLTTADFDDLVFDRIEKTISKLEASGNSENAEALRSLRLEIDVPFF